MFNIIKTDLYKFFKSKTFYVILLVTILFASLNVIGTYFALKNIADGTMTGPNAEHMVANGRELLIAAFGGGIVLMLITVMSSMFIAKEYSTGVIKDTVSSGISRYKIFLSKVIVSSFASVLLIIINILYQGVFISILIDYGAVFNWEEVLFLFKIFINATFAILAFNALFVSFATFFKSLGAALGINIGLLMFGGLIFSLIALISDKISTITEYWIGNNITAVIWNFTENIYEWKTLIISASYLTVAIIFGLLVFKRQDIK